MERARFLSRVRAALADADTPPAAAEYRPPEPSSPDARVERLVRELEAVGGSVYRVASPEEARSAIVEVLKGRGVRRVVRTNTSTLRALGLDGALAEAGIETMVCDLREDGPPRDELRRAALAADAGITEADYGVAETGSLALLARPGNGRSASLLPPIHVAVLAAADLVDELSALFQKVRERGELPSALTLVTGPSRTGDIELVLTVGVHGPGELHLVLVG